MVKSAYKRRAESKDEGQTKKVSHKQFGKWVKSRMAGQGRESKSERLQYDRIQELLEE